MYGLGNNFLVEYESKFPKTQQSYVNAKLELAEYINRCNSGRIHRNNYSKRTFEKLLNRYKFRNTSSFSRYEEPESFVFPSSLESFTSKPSYNDNVYRTGKIKKESATDRKVSKTLKSLNRGGANNSIISKESKKPISLLQMKIDNEFKMSNNRSYLKKLKQETSNLEPFSSHINQDDYEEIVTQILICYTISIIEGTASVIDRDWSGSYTPTPVPDDNFLLYCGGYGCIDGITECENIHLAAGKFQNLHIKSDEAVEALSHMYSLQHLLKGGPERRRSSTKPNFKHIPRIRSSQESESFIFSSGSN